MDIEKNVPCLCNTPKCRQYLMQAKKKDPEVVSESCKAIPFGKEEINQNIMKQAPTFKNKKIKCKTFITTEPGIA